MFIMSNENETVRSIEQNAKRITLKHIILLYIYDNMFRELSIEQQNKLTMINILQGRTLQLLILKYNQKGTNTVFFV